MAYVDGYVLVVPSRSLAAYRRLAMRTAGIWRAHGALAVRECVLEDAAVPGCVQPFTRLLRLKRGELALFSYIVFRSRAHRDRVNAKAFADPRLLSAMQGRMPFDMKRMAYGGFTPIVDL
jgi:uncharacterized protein YbaA (DUF1428 family)